MEVSIFDVIGNGVSNAEVSEVIISKLKKKYQKEFTVKMIGNRFGTYTDDTVTTYCSPKDNENLIFTATLNKEQTKLEDDYELRHVAFELEEEIKEEFKKMNIEVMVKAEVIGKNKIDEFLSVQEFIKKFKGTSFLTYIISNNAIAEETLNKVYKHIEEKYQDIYLKTLLYAVGEEGFKQCYEIYKNSPGITDSIIERYEVKQEVIMKIFEGKIYIIK